MADYDDLNTNRIFTVGIISIVVTAVTALAVQVVYYSLVQWHEADLSERSSYSRQNEVLASQADDISKVGVDEAGNLTIPISQAMQLIATDNGSSDEEAKPDAAKPAAAKPKAESLKLTPAKKNGDHKGSGHDKDGEHKEGEHKDADHKDADHKEADHKEEKHDDKKKDAK